VAKQLPTAGSLPKHDVVPEETDASGEPAGSMTIEDLAREAGTATTTVRMYQSRGLLPPPVRRGRVGFYGDGHLARLRLIAQLQDEGFSLASIKRLIDAWQDGRGLADVLGLEAQVGAAWRPEAPLRLDPEGYAALFGDQVISAENFQRAAAMGLVEMVDGEVVVASPRLLEIGAELARGGVPVDEALDELQALEGLADEIAERFTGVFERNAWSTFVDAGFPPDEVRGLAASLQRLSVLAEDVVEVALRAALRRKADAFLVAQATRLEAAGLLSAQHPLSQLASSDEPGAAADSG
jgi:DNA-binding transcriptional MerR regulator